MKALAVVSGPYFLEPVMLSHRADYGKLDQHEVFELSPGLHPEKIACPVLLFYAENDTDEFRRQTRAFADALAKAVALKRLVRCPSRNQFGLMEAFRDYGHDLIKSILAQLAVPQPPERLPFDKESS